jgi:ankyrin repeat protein
VIATLVKAGGDVNAKNAEGETPLVLAAGLNSNPKMIAALVRL